MILIFTLTVVPCLILKIRIARAVSPIYIRADGSIDPSDSPISSLDNITYTLAGNINNSIIIERSNVTIDGNGHVIQGSRDGNGFALTNISNVTIKNTSIENFYIGIYVNSSSQITISGNRLTGSNRSIELYNSANYNTICGNNMVNNNFSIYMSMNSNHNTIAENNITNNEHPTAIYLAESFDNIISRNKITNNKQDAIYVKQSTENTIEANSITSNHGYGIWLYQSSHNTITANELSDNNKSITLSSNSNDNIIIENNITNNGIYGIYLIQGTNNTFTHNNLIANPKHVNISQPNLPNIWDDELEGNYWSDYVGSDVNHDGIGDTAHMLDVNNSDNRPLMGTFHTYNTSLDQLVNVVSNSTIINFMYFPSDGTIKLKVTNTTVSQTHGFCRITISHALMNTTNLTVVIDEGITQVLFENYALHDNSTHTWIYFAYPHTIHEIVIIHESSTTTLLILLAAATCLITITIRKQNRRDRHNSS
jgi:parallel beta-helix repeat protein